MPSSYSAGLIPKTSTIVFMVAGGDSQFTTHSIFKKGVLVTTHHNKFFDDGSDQAIKVFTPSHVPDDPILHTGYAVWGVKISLTNSKTHNNLQKVSE